MDKKILIEMKMKKDRLGKIVGKGKSTQGVVRRLQREIRNLEK